MNLYEKIINKEEKLSVIGLGYVGLPLAMSFAKKVDVIGFDINKPKVEDYNKGIDATNETGSKCLQETTAFLTSNEKELQKAKDYLKGATSLALDSSDSQASFYAMQELLEKNILTPEEKFKKIDAVTVNDIKKIAEDIFVPEKLNLAVIGPFEEKDSDKLKQLLKI